MTAKKQIRGTVLMPTAQSDFVETESVRQLTDRARMYINAGFPVHFRGPSGTGKTTMAMHLAHLIGRPVVLMHGDAEFNTSDLVGGENGYRFNRVEDNYIHSVRKYEENMNKQWVDNRLTLACRHGYTLLYDEFSRSKPEANNVLLSVLQEKILDIPAGHGETQYLKVHPEFRAIFTSNPEEYAGVNRTQDALRDRMVTLDVDHFDYQTELDIALTKSTLAMEDVEKVVRVVRGLRESAKTEFQPTIRATIMIAKTLGEIGGRLEESRASFSMICSDILASATSRVGSKVNQARVNKLIEEIIDEVMLAEQSA